MVTSEPLPQSGQSFILRRLASADLSAFQAYRSDAELGRYQGWQPTSDEKALAFLLEMQQIPLFGCGQWTQLAIADSENNLIGDIGIFIDADGRQAEIGFTLARRAQGQGIATNAVRLAMQLIFTHTDAADIRAITDTRNQRSVRLLERLGLRRESMREAEFRGERCTEYIYTIARCG